MQAVREPARDSDEVAAGEPEHEQRRRGRRCGRRRRSAPRRAAPRAPRRSAPASGGVTITPSSPAGGSKRAAPRRSAQIDEAAEQRRGDVVGMALELAVACSNSGASSSYMWSAAARPATIAAALDPSPADDRDLRADPERQPVGGVQRLERAHARGSCGRAGRPAGRSRPQNSPVSSTSSSRYSDSAAREHVVARPEVGRRGRDADACGGGSLAPEHRLLDALDVRLAGDDRAARSSAVCGSFRPWPVSTQTTLPCGAVLEQPGDRGGRGRLAEDALARGRAARRRRGSRRRSRRGPRRARR